MRDYSMRDAIMHQELPYKKEMENGDLVTIVDGVFEYKGKYASLVIEFSLGDADALVNGVECGRTVYARDIDFCMPFDHIGGITLVLKDGDFITMRMDGLLLSFMNIPFDKLQDKEYVKSIKAQYRKDWYATL